MKKTLKVSVRTFLPGAFQLTLSLVEIKFLSNDGVMTCIEIAVIACLKHFVRVAIIVHCVYTIIIMMMMIQEFI